MTVEAGGSQESISSTAQKIADLAETHSQQGKFTEAIDCVGKIEAMVTLAKQQSASEAEQDAVIRTWHETGEGVLQSVALKLRLGISIEGRF